MCLIHSFHNYFYCLLAISLGGVGENLNLGGEILTLDQKGFFESLVFMVQPCQVLVNVLKCES